LSGVWHAVQHMRKNQYEEALFRCEDDRFELDMAIECSQSAVKALTQVVKDVADMDAEARERFRLDKSKILSIHFRMVHKIYGTGPGPRLLTSLDKEGNAGWKWTASW
jgi:paired amphipathic helix protein Sin3a